MGKFDNYLNELQGPKVATGQVKTQAAGTGADVGPPEPQPPEAVEGIEGLPKPQSKYDQYLQSLEIPAPDYKGPVNEPTPPMKDPLAALRLDTPAGKASAMFLAGSAPLLDAAVPGAEPASEAEAKFILHEYAAEGTPITPAEAQTIARKRQAAREEAYPVQATTGSLLGLGLSGVMMGGIEGPVSNLAARSGSKLLPEVASIGAQATLGGLENMLRKRHTSDTPIRDTIEGTLYSSLFLGALKTPGLAKGAVQDLSKVNDWLVSAERKEAKAAIDRLKKAKTLTKERLSLNESRIKQEQDAISFAERDLENVHKNIPDVEPQATGTEEALRTIESRYAPEQQAISESENYLKSAAEKKAALEPILAQGEQKAAAIGRLPDEMKSRLQTRLDDMGRKKAERLKQFESRIIRIDREYERAANKIMAFKGATGPAQAQQAAALAALKNFDDAIDVRQIITPADPVRGIKEKVSVVRRPSAGQADIAKQHLQDLLYNRDFVANAPKPVRDAIREFEESVRNRISSVDPTGDLAAYNNGYHALRTAQDQLDEHAKIGLFENLAAGKTDSPTVSRKLDAIYDTMSSKEELKALGKTGSVSGLHDRSLENKYVRETFAEARGELRALQDERVTDFGKYQEAKRAWSTLDQEERKVAAEVERARLKLQDKMDREQNSLLSKFDREQAAQERKQATIESKREREKTRLQNSIERGQGRIQNAEARSDALELSIENRRAQIRAQVKDAQDRVFGLGKYSKIVQNEPIKDAARKLFSVIERSQRSIPGKAAGALGRGAAVQPFRVRQMISDQEE